MGTNKNEKKDTAPVLAHVQISRNHYDAVVGGCADEKIQADLFNRIAGEMLAVLCEGGRVLSATVVGQIKDLTGLPVTDDNGLIEAIARGMSKTMTGRTVLRIDVDHAFVETLKQWARAGGHEDDWEQYVTDAFGYIMHQGWLCGVPTNAVQLQFTPQDWALLEELIPLKDGQRITGTDVVALVRRAIDETTPAPFMGEPEKAQVPA